MIATRTKSQSNNRTTDRKGQDGGAVDIALAITDNNSVHSPEGLSLSALHSHSRLPRGYLLERAGIALSSKAKDLENNEPP